MSLSIEHQTESTDGQEEHAAGPIIALIPAYNEERFIGSLVLTTLEHVDEVIVIDDGSSDRTSEIAAKAGATVITHRVNQGKAAAVNTGFTAARRLNPIAAVMLDGDGQHSADDIPVIIAPVLNGEADVVVGSRFLEVKSDIPAYRQVGQHGLTAMTNLASGVRVSDSQSGFRAFSAEALEHLSFSQGGFSIESEMQFQVREHKLRIVEAPIKVIYAEPAKRNPFKHGMQVVDGVLRLVVQMRPLLYFGAVGLALLLSGLALGLYVVSIWAQTQALALGLALLTVILCVVGVVLIFAGVLLHVLRAMFVELRKGLVTRIAREHAHASGGGGPKDRVIDLGPEMRGMVKTRRPLGT